jgi:hypothetical protein
MYREINYRDPPIFRLIILHSRPNPARRPALSGCHCRTGTMTAAALPRHHSRLPVPALGYQAREPQARFQRHLTNARQKPRCDQGFYE